MDDLIYEEHIVGRSEGIFTIARWDEDKGIYCDQQGYPLDPNVIAERARIHQSKNRNFIVDTYVKRACADGMCEQFGLHMRYSPLCNAVKPEYRAKTETYRSPKKGYIYAVKCGDKIKAGRCIDLKNRFNAYKKVTFEFSVIAIARVDDYVESERTLLQKFGGKANRQEWFEYSPELEASMGRYVVEKFGGEYSHA